MERAASFTDDSLDTVVETSLAILWQDIGEIALKKKPSANKTASLDKPFRPQAIQAQSPTKTASFAPSVKLPSPSSLPPYLQSAQSLRSSTFRH
jgi:hypothetical protein